MMRAAVQTGFTPAPAVLQRDCGCGGTCDSCHKDNALGSAGGVRLGPRDDVHEREADHVADRVVGGGPAGIQRQSVEEDENLQRQPEKNEEDLQMKTSGPANGAAVPAAANAVATGGRPMAAAERAFFEPRFGRDLSHVRLHTDEPAAHGIGALAYTLRNHIAFAPGQFDASSTEGRRLIAHEVAHTFQQGAPAIRRTCPTDPAAIPAGTSADFEREVDEIRALSAYTSLPRDAKRTADHIIEGARGSACPMYYIRRLRVLFDTPVNSSAQTTSQMRQRSVDAAAVEQQRLSDPVWASFAGVEEAATGSANRQWRTAHGDGADYRIDDHDVTRIYVHMKVRPRARGTGTQADVNRTVSLEDGIETQALNFGYVLDVEFVTRGGSGVFDVGVDPSGWTTSGNWVGAPGPLAHEAHHLLGLEDRYDYLSHAENRNMQIPTRLHWFREQMVRAADLLSRHSKMRSSSAAGVGLNEQDICALVGSNFRTCLVSRYAMRPTTELEGLGRELNHPYRPQHAALLEVLEDAWERRPLAEQTSGCADADPLCGLPPETAFGDPNIRGTDARRFPVANPHSQPAGSSLARTPRTP